MTREIMIALGMTDLGFLVSAARAVQLSKPTRMRIASVDWTRMPVNECGRMESNAPLKDHSVACCGLVHRYQMARPLKTTSVTNWMMLIQRLVRVEPVPPR